MAIHKNNSNIEVTVCCDGKALTEYAMVNDEVKHEIAAVREHQQKQTVTSYVEAITGKSFVVVIKVKDTSKLKAKGLSFELYAEGKWMYSSLLVKESCNKRRWSETLIGPESQKNNQTFMREMVFADIPCDSRTSKHAKGNFDKTRFQDLGSIRVLVYREKNIVRCTSDDVSPIDVPEVYQDKALINDFKSHTISFSDAKKGEYKEWWNADHRDGEDYPILIFHFKYRSKQMLQYLDVINELPSPVTEYPVKLPPTVTNHSQERRVQAESCQVQSRVTELSPPTPLEAGTPAALVPLTAPAGSTPPLAPTILVTQPAPLAAAPNLLDPAQLQAQFAQFTQFQLFLQSQMPNGLQALPAPVPDVSNPCIKRERTDDEVNRKSRKPKKMLGKMIVDLTEDDDEDKIRNSIEIED